MMLKSVTQNLLKPGLTALLWIVVMFLSSVQADLLNPDCTPEKAAKSAAAKATVGIGGRCSPAEAVKDTAKRSIGIEDKGPLEKRNNGKEGSATGAVKKLVK